MPLLQAAQTTFTVDGTKAVYIAVPEGQSVTVYSNGNTLYYDNASTVTSSSNDGNIATAASATFTSPQYVICAQGASTSVFVDAAESFPVDLRVGDDLTVVDDLTVSDTATITGISTLTGGIGATSTKARALGIRSGNWETVSTLSATGTDAASASGTAVYLVSVFVPVNCTVTGIATLNGTNVTTDKVVNDLFNAAGTKVGQTAAAGTVPNADLFDELDLTAPATVTGPAVYFIGRQHDGTTIGFQSIPADKGHEPLAGSVAGTSFGAETSVVPPTTFTTNKAPYGYLY